MGYGSHIVPELAEAAARTGDIQLLTAALEWLSERTRATPTEWVLGIEGRVRALLSEGERPRSATASRSSMLGRTRVRAQLARTHLLYGEWLRRENRRADAREQLRTAHEMLEAMGAEAFAERARRELLATGETVRKRASETSDAADCPGGPSRPAGPRRPVQPGNRRPAVHQLAHGPVPPAQGLHQARHQLPKPAPPGPAQRPDTVVL